MVVERKSACYGRFFCLFAHYMLNKIMDSLQKEYDFDINKSMRINQQYGQGYKKLITLFDKA